MITLTCAHCSGAFQVPPYRTDAKYCSMVCYLAERWAKSGHCAQCGKDTSTRFCSDMCRKAYWNTHDYAAFKKDKIWERKLALIKELGGRCQKCGNDDIRVLDINHKDRARKVQPNNGQYAWSRRFNDWKANDGNLELLCANCHRIHTWKQMGYGKSTHLAANEAADTPE